MKIFRQAILSGNELYSLFVSCEYRSYGYTKTTVSFALDVKVTCLKAAFKISGRIDENHLQWENSIKSYIIK
jgi:hypothetical protein